MILGKTSGKKMFYLQLLQWKHSEGKRKERAIGAVRSTPETTKMGRLSLMFSLAVLLFAANSLAAVNEAQLQRLVRTILNRYRPTYFSQSQRKSPMFSLVVRIPFNSKTKTYDISQVPDYGNDVRNTIIGCDVYTGTNILAATVLRWPDVVYQCPNAHVQWRMPRGSRATTWEEAHNLNPRSFCEGTAVHAEYRTLENLNTWLNNQDIGQDLLLIYVFASPCTTKCTNINNEANILQFLQHYVKFNIVFVFSKVFQPRNAIIPTEVMQVALRNLGGTIGLQRVFRCDHVNSMTCVNCNDNGNVAVWCYNDNHQLG